VLLSPVKYTVSALAGSLLMLASLLGSNLWTYQRLTNEVLVGDIEFSRLDDTSFNALLVLSDGDKQHFVIQGDEWQLDARVIKWQSWASLLGKDPLFRLDRLSGRYRDTEKARRTLPTLYSLSESSMVDLWELVHKNPDLLFMIDASYGSSVFLPLQDGVKYRIVMSQTGLLARRINKEKS